MSEGPEHVPVLVNEVLTIMAFGPGQLVVDGTIGLAGHSLAILDRLAGTGRLVGCDLDPEALTVAAERTAPYRGQVTLLRRSFAELAAVVAELAPGGVDRVLLDLGVSRAQLTSPRFSFQHDAPLDCRLDPTRGETAAQLLARLSEEELTALLRELADEPFAHRIARGVVEARRTSPVATTAQLNEIVRRAYPPKARHGRMHVATRTYQMLRLKVNHLLEALDQALATVPRLLRPGGMLGIVSFHSIEDRKVKYSFKSWAATGEFRLVTRKPVTAERAEVVGNPSARSAKLRVLQAVEATAREEAAEAAAREEAAEAAAGEI